MTTIENLKELESELNSLSKAYSGTMAAITLDDEHKAVTRVIKFLEEKEEWYKCLYYKNLLKENKNLLSSKELEKLNNNWLNSKGMINLCDKYNIAYNIINFHL